VRRGRRREIAVALAVEEAVDDARAAPRGQVQRQALAAERGLHLLEHHLAIDAGDVDAVDDDHAVQAPVGGPVHHAHRRGVDAGGRVDDDRRGLDGLERGQRLAHEFRGARRVEEVDADAVVLQVQHRGGEGMLDAAFERIVVAERGAAFHAAGRLGGPRADRQGLSERGLAGG
jgi:hypothetical protein